MSVERLWTVAGIPPSLRRRVRAPRGLRERRRIGRPARHTGASTTWSSRRRSATMPRSSHLPCPAPPGTSRATHRGRAPGVRRACRPGSRAATLRYPRIAELAFDSSLKRMITSTHAPDGRPLVACEGSPRGSPPDRHPDRRPRRGATDHHGGSGSDPGDSGGRLGRRLPRSGGRRRPACLDRRGSRGLARPRGARPGALRARGPRRSAPSRIRRRRRCSPLRRHHPDHGDRRSPGHGTRDRDHGSASSPRVAP